ncbi:MAG: DUF202 domain-containing protein [Hyphomicrobiales bacterium]|nr:MAG: DUF202 domain-containing protein [Hyphomicrobiales bacterium]
MAQRDEAGQPKPPEQFVRPERPQRPAHLVSHPLPDLPVVEGMPADQASTTYSHYRTGLSHRRTNLSEHRTDLSEYRTDLSTFRTDLSDHRTDLSEYRTSLSDHRTDLSMHRTGLGIQRTRMAADRTLMAVIRTSLSLIGFGFTIYQVFEKLHEAGTIAHANAPRNMGLALIVAGIVMMVGGIWRHIEFAREMREGREDLIEHHLLHGKRKYPISITLIVAVGLTLIGIVAIVSILLD